MPRTSHSRRAFLGSAGGALSGSAAGAAALGARPNVLLICVDDLRPELGCYGHPEMLTPNIDRLAAEGRRFTRHYVQSAVCGPSRCSLLTGKRINNWDCWKGLRGRPSEPAEPASFAHLFRRNGYRTVCIGKVSHQPGGVIDEEQRVHQVPFSWDKSYAPVGAWGTPWRAFFAYAGGKAYNRVIRMRKDEPMLPYEAAAVDDLGYADGLNAEAAVKELEGLKGRGQPFLLGVGFYKPHLPFNAPRRYWDLYPAAKAGWASNPRPPQGVDPAISLHRSFEVTTHYHWPPGEGNISREDASTLRRGYFACVSYVDAQIGKVLAALQRLQLDGSTVVALWSDHGWHLGEHGMQTNFEVAARSPLIIRVPGMAKPGEAAAGLAESVDLYPTLAGLCGLKVPAGLAGRSLEPALRDPAHRGKEYAYSFHPRGEIMGRAFRTDRYRLVAWTKRDGEVVQVELYDHRSDPEENVNVASKRPEVVKPLLRELLATPWPAETM
jgi:arylsulfatase A-like enzyme